MVDAQGEVALGLVVVVAAAREVAGWVRAVVDCDVAVMAMAVVVVRARGVEGPAVVAMARVVAVWVAEGSARVVLGSGVAVTAKVEEGSEVVAEVEGWELQRWAVAAPAPDLVV